MRTNGTTTAGSAGVDRSSVVIALILGVAGTVVAVAVGSSLSRAVLLGAVTVAVVTGVAAALTASVNRNHPAPSGSTSASSGAAAAMALPYDARGLVERAERATAELVSRDWGDAADGSGLAVRAAPIADLMRRRARSLIGLDLELAAGDTEAMEDDLERLEQERDAAVDPVLRGQLEGSVTAVRSRLDTHAELQMLRDRLLAALESTANRLEAALAQAGLLASRRMAGDLDDRLPGTGMAALLVELDAIRRTLDETGNGDGDGDGQSLDGTGSG